MYGCRAGVGQVRSIEKIVIIQTTNFDNTFDIVSTD